MTKVTTIANNDGFCDIDNCISRVYSFMYYPLSDFGMKEKKLLFPSELFSLRKLDYSKINCGENGGVHYSVK